MRQTEAPWARQDGFVRLVSSNSCPRLLCGVVVCRIQTYPLISTHAPVVANVISNGK